MRWFTIRKANIDRDLREAFEQYGVSVMQLNLALGDYIQHKGKTILIKDILIPLSEWLTEQYDNAERKETWTLTMEFAIVTFVAELIFSIVGFLETHFQASPVLPSRQ